MREWPREGQIAAEVPSSSKELLLILSGKVIDENKALFDYERDMGEFGVGSILTIHLVIRRPTSPKNAKKESKTTSCCCTVQ